MANPHEDANISNQITTFCYDSGGRLYAVKEFGITREATEEERNRGKNATGTGLTARRMTPEESRKYFGHVDDLEG